jgi:hypothetical protein
MFLARFLRHPLRVGAVAPSSPTLAAHVVAPVPGQGDPMVVELGPGTGAFTRAIQDRLGGRGYHLAVEADPVFAATLRHRYSRVDVAFADAADLPALLARRGLPAADVVVSGLPWTVFPGRRATGTRALGHAGRPCFDRAPRLGLDRPLLGHRHRVADRPKVPAERQRRGREPRLGDDLEHGERRRRREPEISEAELRHERHRPPQARGGPAGPVRQRPQGHEQQHHRRGGRRVEAVGSDHEQRLNRDEDAGPVPHRPIARPDARPNDTAVGCTGAPAGRSTPAARAPNTPATAAHSTSTRQPRTRTR